MKFNPKLKQDVEKYRDYVIIVEGKKDVSSLRVLGFDKVFAIHNTGVPLRERVEQIIRGIDLKKDRVCILTDFDRKGKQLYLLLKREFSELGVKLDSNLRGILLKSGVSHIEGLDKFMEKVGKI